MPLPLSLTQPVGFGATEDASRDTYLVQQMHAIATAIYQAKQRNDKVDAANLLTKFQELANEYRARGASDLTPFDNFVLATGAWIEQSVDAIPNALAALPVAVGSGLIKAAIPFALLYAGYLWLTSSRRRF
jgi:hypothetical protein